MNSLSDVPREALAGFCRRHHITRLAVFGSILREDFGPDSDVDVLVAFEPGRVPGWEFIDTQDGLEALFGRRVDLFTEEAVQSSSNRIRKAHILESAKVIYEQERR